MFSAENAEDNDILQRMANDMLYGILTSSMDSVLGGLVGSGITGGLGLTGNAAAWVGGSVIGAEAAAQSMQDIAARGGSVDQVLSGGLMAGAFETLFEQFSLSQLHGLKQIDLRSALADGKLLNTIARNVGTGMLTNGSEELFTELANVMYDTYTMGELSNYAESVERYMAWGLTEAEARKRTATDLANQVLEAGYTGALQGLLMDIGGLAAHGVDTWADPEARAQQADRDMEEWRKAVKDWWGEEALAEAEAGQIGLVRDSYVKSALGSSTAERLDRVAKALGLNVRFVDRVAGGIANSSIQGKQVLIEKGNPNPVNFLLGHEITHRMQELAPAQYQRFKELVANEADTRLDARETLENYRQKGLDLTDEGALDEAVADYAGRMMEDGQLLDNFIRRYSGERTLLEKLRDAFRALIEKLHGGERRQAQLAVDRLNRALDTAAANAQNNTAVQESGVERYSISTRLPHDLQAVRNGTFQADRGEVYIGESSSFLTNTIGADKLTVTMPASKAYSAMVTEAEARRDGRYQENVNYHGLGVEGLMQALEASENPVAAFADTLDNSGKRADHIVLVTDQLDSRGDYIAVVQQVGTRGRLDGKRIDANKVITTYGRTALAADIEKAAIDGRLLHLGKKGSQNILAGRPGANSLAAIQEADFKNNIQRFWENVKWEKSGSQTYTAEGQANSETELGRKLREAMAQAAENGTAQTTETAATEDGGARYSIKRTSQMTLAAQLKMFYDGKMASSDAFYFGETADTLAAAGLDPLPLALTVSDFRKSNKEKHNVPRRVWKSLNENLKNALFAFRQGDRVGIMTGDIDGDGKPLLVGIERNAIMDRKPVNAIRSVYGLDNPGPWLQNQFKSGKEYIPLNKQRADAFLQTYGAYSASVGDGIHSLDGIITQNEPESNSKFSLKGTDHTRAGIEHRRNGETELGRKLREVMAQANTQRELALAKSRLQSQYKAALTQAKASGDFSRANALYKELVRIQKLKREDDR